MRVEVSSHRPCRRDSDPREMFSELSTVRVRWAQGHSLSCFWTVPRKTQVRCDKSHQGHSGAQSVIKLTVPVLVRVTAGQGLYVMYFDTVAHTYCMFRPP